MEEKVIKAIKEGRNIFISGCGGVGKSWMLNMIKQKYNKFCITSSTGVSALLIGGITFHSMSGIGLGRDTVDDYVQKIRYNAKQFKYIKALEGIILDECSMLGASYFEKVDSVFRKIRGVNEPFGGIQMIISGDFFQLPPVQDKYLFETSVWYEMNLVNIILTEVKRQTDKDFIKVLLKLREGKMTKDIAKFLETYVREADDDIIKLCPLKKQADSHNKKMLDQIDEEERTYDAKMGAVSKVSPTVRDSMFNFMMENMTAPNHLMIKKSCKVLYLINDKDKKLVNGSEGIVVDFIKSYPLVKFGDKIVHVTPHRYEVKDKDENVFYYEQLPLLVCYAISIHKSQGLSLQKASINIGSKIFTQGQAYVALSRIISLEGLYIESFDKRSFIVDDKVSTFYTSNCD